jgi:hypothetical protein
LIVPVADRLCILAHVKNVKEIENEESIDFEEVERNMRINSKEY